jgi:hypothetical protein
LVVAAGRAEEGEGEVVVAVEEVVGESSQGGSLVGRQSCPQGGNPREAGALGNNSNCHSNSNISH